MRLAFAPLALAAVLAAAPSASSEPLEIPAGTPLPLAGQWRFQAGDDPAWAGPAFDDTGWTAIAVPTGWGPAGYDGPTAPLVWYRKALRFEGGPGRPPVAVTLGKVDSAYEVYANGRRLGGVGALPPAPSAEYDRHASWPIPADLIGADGSVVLALRVWKAPITNSRAGGLVEGPFLAGPLAELVRRESRSELFELALVVVFLLSAVVHLHLYRRRRPLDEYLWFGVMSLGAAIYTLLRTQWKYELSDDFVLLKKLEHLALYVFSAVFVQFVWPFIGRRIGPVLRAYQLANVGLGCVLFATPGLAATLALLPWWQVGVALLTPAVLWAVVDAVRQGRPEARTVGQGMLLLIVAYISDILVDRGVYVLPRLTPFGFGAFQISMVISLAGRFSRVHQELEGLRQQLERRVEERTAELTRRTAELAEASRAKSLFLANVSHEIRTPMNGVIGMTRLLLDTRLSPEQREYAEIIRSSGRSLLAIINDILDFSKIESGRLELERIDFDLRALVEDVARGFREQARQKRIGFELEVAEDAPRLVRSDPVRLRQALANLLSNAVKFTDAGHVRLRASGTPHEARFEVEDSGIGIPEASRARIFEPFSQGDASTTRRFGGTGLGLAITRSIVELLDGQIGFETRVGEGSGTRFWFTARLEPATAGLAGGTFVPRAERQEPSPVGPASVSPQGALGRVLLAEDHSVNQLVMLRILEKLGYAADVAATGREAVRAALERRYDLVLMDCQMPELDGYEATREIRRRESGRRTPIVALTASALDGDRARALEAGMDDHLTKPVTPDALASALERWTRAPAPRPALDPGVLGELRALTTPGFVEEAMAMFLASAARSVDRVRGALQRGDLAELERAAHSLRGSCAIIGARPMMELAAALEERARTGEAGEPGALSALEAEFRRVTDAIARERQDEPVTGA
ncbi:MAG: ATP-binding protein [Vicinamibacteria bacterium]